MALEPAAKITVTPSYSEEELLEQIQSELDKYNQLDDGVERETARLNYHYLQSFYHANKLHRFYDRVEITH